MQRRGSMLFTHFGLSGPAALDVSRAITAAADPRKLRLVVDYLPDTSDAALEQKLRQAAAGEGKRLVASVVAEWDRRDEPGGSPLPRRLVDALLARARVAADRRVAELSALERGRLIDQLKRCEIRVTGSRGFEKAEVTAGGVALGEVDSRNMQSMLVPNLFLAGEILDLDGFIGGYNFQAAFSTGWLAGESV
jgi:predicted Rossmann fold flavoprotein